MVLQLEDVRVTPGGSVAPQVPSNESPVVMLQVDGARAARLQLPSTVEIVVGDPTTATPASLWIGGLRRPDLRLRRPVLVTVEREGEHITVWSDVLEQIGYGPHLTAAIEDFQQTVAELYLTLKADETRLGPEMARLWQVVKDLIEERP